MLEANFAKANARLQAFRGSGMKIIGLGLSVVHILFFAK